MLCGGGDVTVLRGADEGVGWCAPAYGQLVPTSTVRVDRNTEAPFVLVTWIGSARAFSSPRLRCTQLKGSREPAVIVEIADEATTATFLVRSADPSRAREVWRVGEFETDAAMFHYVAADGRLRSVSMIDGQHAVSSHDGWVSLSADGPMPDFHLALSNDEIVCLSAEADGALTVHGTAGCTSLRTNGHELPLSSKSTTDTLLIHGSDWRPISSGNATPAARPHFGAAFARH